MNNGIQKLVEDGKVNQEKFHPLQVQGRNGQVGIIKIPHSAMKCCANCGHDRFVQQFNVGFVKNPNHIGSEPVQIMTAIFVCCKCGEEVGLKSPQVGERKIQEGAK